MIHEFGHHVDGQLSVLNGENGKFSEWLFDKIKEDNSAFDDIKISRYAESFYQKTGSRTESFAEYFAEAYGETPGENAKTFKVYLEKYIQELVK